MRLKRIDDSRRIQTDFFASIKLIKKYKILTLNKKEYCDTKSSKIQYTLAHTLRQAYTCGPQENDAMGQIRPAGLEFDTLLMERKSVLVV